LLQRKYVEGCIHEDLSSCKQRFISQRDEQDPRARLNKVVTAGQELHFGDVFGARVILGKLDWRPQSQGG